MVMDAILPMGFSADSLDSDDSDTCGDPILQQVGNAWYQNRMSATEGEEEESVSCKGYVQLGDLRTVGVYDTGSYRNAVDATYLRTVIKDYEKRAGELISSDERPCGRVDIEGLTKDMTDSFDHIVNLTVTFRGFGGKTASVTSEFVVMPKLASPILLGNPLLDDLHFGVNDETIELRAFDLELPYWKNDAKTYDPGTAPVAVASDYTDVEPGKLKTIWVNTNADPTKKWYIKPSPQIDPELVVAEGPAQIQNRIEHSSRRC